MGIKIICCPDFTEHNVIENDTLSQAEKELQSPKKLSQERLISNSRRSGGNPKESNVQLKVHKS
jgi:hypothetical protein